MPSTIGWPGRVTQRISRSSLSSRHLRSQVVPISFLKILEKWPECRHDQAHAVEDALVDAIDDFVGDLLVVHVAPPEHDVGVVDDVGVEAVLGIVEDAGADGEAAGLVAGGRRWRRGCRWDRSRRLRACVFSWRPSFQMVTRMGLWVIGNPFTSHVGTRVKRRWRGGLGGMCGNCARRLYDRTREQPGDLPKLRGANRLSAGVRGRSAAGVREVRVRRWGRMMMRSSAAVAAAAEGSTGGESPGDHVNRGGGGSIDGSTQLLLMILR